VKKRHATYCSLEGYEVPKEGEYREIILRLKDCGLIKIEGEKMDNSLSISLLLQRDPLLSVLVADPLFSKFLV